MCYYLLACIKQGMWCPANYIDLNCPLSQCVSLQWTIRDASVINLPVGLLVEGDVILLRPGQVIPAKCHKMKVFSLVFSHLLTFDKQIYIEVCGKLVLLS